MTTYSWYAGLLTALGLAAVGLAGCEPGGCGGVGGASDVCPPPVYGRAEVRGHVLRSDGTPASRKQASVACGDVVGVYSDVTDDAGRFELRLTYAVFDTTLYPFPARAADGSFVLECTGSLVLSRDVTILKDPLAVTFAPPGTAVVPTETEWREGEARQSASRF